MILAENIIVKVRRRYQLPPAKNLYLVYDKEAKYAMQFELTQEVNLNLRKIMGSNITGFAYADICSDPTTEELTIELKRSAPDQSW